MTLHTAYTMGTMCDDIVNMRMETPETWLRELRHVDEEGETALSLLLKIEASDFFVTVLLQMDKWALGVRCKKTGSFPVHVVYERKFSLQLRKIVAAESLWIMCSYNNDGNTVLHLALGSKCEESIVHLLQVMSNTALMLTAFVHENKQGKIPLELAIEIRPECSSNEFVSNILEATFLSGYACETIFANKSDSIVAFDCASEPISMFASFYRNSSDGSLQFHKIEYEHCGRMIELESENNCERSVERKKALVCDKYEDNLYRKITAIRKNDRGDYDDWMAEATLMKYMRNMKCIKEYRAIQRADLVSRALVKEKTEFAELMACRMIEAEEKDKSMKADASARKQKAKQENKKKRMLKQLEEKQLKQEKETARLQTISEKKKANELLAQKKSDDAEIRELLRLAKEHQKNIKLKDEAERSELVRLAKEHEKKTCEKTQEQRAETANECCMCLEKTKNIVLVPCNHLCVCESCAEDLMKNPKASCPLCRATVEKIIKVFL